MLTTNYITRYDFVNNEQKLITQLSFVRTNVHARKLYLLLSRQPKCIYQNYNTLVLLKGKNTVQLFRFFFDE